MSHDVTCTTCGSELKYVGDTLGSSAGFVSPRSVGCVAFALAFVASVFLSSHAHAQQQQPLPYKDWVVMINGKVKERGDAIKTFESYREIACKMKDQELRKTCRAKYGFMIATRASEKRTLEKWLKDAAPEVNGEHKRPDEQTVIRFNQALDVIEDVWRQIWTDFPAPHSDKD